MSIKLFQFEYERIQRKQIKSHMFQKLISLILGQLFFFTLPITIKDHIWDKIMPQDNSDKLIHTWDMIGTVAFISFWVLNFVQQLIYHFNLFNQWKVNDKPWPWDDKKAQLGQTWNKFLFKSILLVLSNQLIFGQITVEICKKLNIYKGISFYTKDIEYGFTLIVKILLFTVIEDITFYCAHRTLHHPLLQSKIHKYHHNYKTTISLAAVHAHPIEYVFSNFLSSMFPTFIIPCHSCTVVIWILQRVLETCDGHSGLEFPWSIYRQIPLSASAQFHDFHHSHNIGNQSSFFQQMDQIFGTDKKQKEHFFKNDLVKNNITIKKDTEDKKKK